MSAAPNRLELTDANVRAGWAELPSRYEWHVFATLTYKEPVWTPEKVLRDFKRWLWAWQLDTAVDRGLADTRIDQKHDGYGRLRSSKQKVAGPWFNSYRKGRARPVWLLGVEHHRTGALHAHAIIKWSDQLPDLDRRLGWKLWNASKREGGFGHGFARIEPPRGQDDVASYVSKYVVKGGEVYLSASFDAHRLAAA